MLILQGARRTQPVWSPDRCRSWGPQKEWGILCQPWPRKGISLPRQHCSLGIGGLVDNWSDTSLFFNYLAPHCWAPLVFFLLFFAPAFFFSPNILCSFSDQSQCSSPCHGADTGALRPVCALRNRGLALLIGAQRVRVEWVDLWLASIWAWWNPVHLLGPFRMLHPSWSLFLITPVVIHQITFKRTFLP